MPQRRNLLHLLPVATLGMLYFAAAPLMAAEPKVYRCGPEGSQWFSQIPCEEDSEELIVEDHHMFRETDGVAPPADDAVSENGQSNEADAEEDTASKAQAFITQLEKQRSEQLDDIDHRIQELESQSAGDGADTEVGAEAGFGAEGEIANDESPSEAPNEAMLQQLAELKRNRQSIVSEYDAMISAAQQRINTP